MNWINIVTYIFILFVFLWGMKFAGFKGKYHEDFMSVSATKSLRGFAALLVLFHHISQEQPFMDADIIQAFYRIGPALVAVFFFCSGYGLIKNMDSKPDYFKGFLKKRIGLGLLIPFYVNIFMYGIYFLISGERFEPIQWVTNLLGVTMMNAFAWFPIVLALLYLAFYVIFKHIKNRKIGFLLMLLVIVAQGVFFCYWGHFAWWANPKPGWWLQMNGFAKAAWWMQEKVLWFSGEWWVNSSVGFLVGMIWAAKEQPIRRWFKKHYWWKLALSVVIFVGLQLFTVRCQWTYGYWSEFWKPGPQIGSKLITYFSQLPQIASFLVMAYVIRMKVKVFNPILSFFGKYSLHTYLMNLLAIMVFRFLIFQNGQPYYEPFGYNLVAYIVAVPAGSILLALVEEKLCKWIAGLGSRKRCA